jgi:hypothetical protein
MRLPQPEVGPMGHEPLFEHHQYPHHFTVEAGVLTKMRAE